MSHEDYKFDQFYNRWSLVNNLIVLAGFTSTLATGSYAYWIGIVVLSFGLYFVKLPRFLPSFPVWIGYPNWISLTRLIVTLITVSIHNFLSDITLLITFLSVILMDGLDGVVARRLNQTSKPGEYFDMEIDALFVFLLSCLHYTEQKLGVWILVPGSMRYVYGVLFFWMKEPPRSRPGKKIRSTIAVIFFLSLLFPFSLTEDIYTPLMLFSSALIIISFGISIVSGLIYNISFNRSSDPS
jgi:phosphatidylglycerophosphate synthase